MPSASLNAVHAARPSLVRAGLASHPPVASATGQSRPSGAPGLAGGSARRRTSPRRRPTGTRSRCPGCGLVEELLAASGRAGGPRMGRARRRRPRPGRRPCGDAGRRRTTRPGRSRRPRSRAAGSTGGGWPRWSSWRSKRLVAALDLPLVTVVGHVLDLHRRGVTVVLTLDPVGGTVVTLIGGWWRSGAPTRSSAGGASSSGSRQPSSPDSPPRRRR
jgi:hypothetical protein